MADLVRNHAGELIRRLGFVEKALEDVSVPGRERDGIGFRSPDEESVEWDWQACCGLDLTHELIECRSARLLLRGISAFESGAGMAAVEARAHLPRDRRAEFALDRVRNDAAELGRDPRHPKDGDQDERSGGSQAPDDDFRPHAPLAAAAAVDWQRPVVEDSGQSRVAELEPREDGAAGLAEA